jgi:carboxyl-terminal processing protease
MRSRKLIIIGVSILIVAGAVLFVQRASSQRQMHQAYLSVSNGVADVASKVHGQIGVYLETDTATGLPVVKSMLIGSPAELAGLKPGDVISHVSNKSLSGVPLAQAASWIRGISGGSVELTVQRASTTNALNFTIHRASVKTLKSL